MRLNKYIALSTPWSRRRADEIISAGRVTVNHQTARLGQSVNKTDQIRVDDALIEPATLYYLALHKPVGYVSSRRGQGTKTIAELLPPKYHHLQTVGRLDKLSSGLILLTNDGDFALHYSHPRFAKTKVYEVKLKEPLAVEDVRKITIGVLLNDGLSQLQVAPIGSDRRHWRVTMNEGRNRQIRRTFLALGNHVERLHRLSIGPYQLGDLPTKQFKVVEPL